MARLSNGISPDMQRQSGQDKGPNSIGKAEDVKAMRKIQGLKRGGGGLSWWLKKQQSEQRVTRDSYGRRWKSFFSGGGFSPLRRELLGAII